MPRKAILGGTGSKETKLRHCAGLFICRTQYQVSCVAQNWITRPMQIVVRHSRIPALLGGTTHV
jgi:hypothetical protein